MTSGDSPTPYVSGSRIAVAATAGLPLLIGKYRLDFSRKSYGPSPISIASSAK